MALARCLPVASSQNAARFCSAPFHPGRSLLRRLEGNGQGKSQSGSGAYSQSIYKSQFILRTAGGATASERDAGSTKGGRGKRSAVGADRQQGRCRSRELVVERQLIARDRLLCQSLQRRREDMAVTDYRQRREHHHAAGEGAGRRIEVCVPSSGGVAQETRH